MPDDASVAPRTGKRLLRATNPFARESRARSWWCVSSTFAVLGAVLATAAVLPWWPARLVASFLGGLLLVRAFILFHDFMHGAILRKSRIANAVFYLYGLVLLCPARAWRHSHNFHHGHVGKPVVADGDEFSLLIPDVGTFPLMTTTVWRRASALQRFQYRVARHPLTMLAAGATVFLYSICLGSLLRNPRKYWDSAFSFLAHGAIVAALWVFAGPLALFFVFWLPFMIAAATGAYLFFAQHNFDGMRILAREDWTFDGAALMSSSYMKLGPIMNWFTGNIGYHHVHHLNSHIPFYRLPKAMAAIPELQAPVITSFGVRDVLLCLRLNLWDPEGQRLVRFREAAGAS